jgi:hypothetical protein
MLGGEVASRVRHRRYSDEIRSAVKLSVRGCVLQIACIPFLDRCPLALELCG